MCVCVCVWGGGEGGWIYRTQTGVCVCVGGEEEGYSTVKPIYRI